jgi:hypothetical protein
MKLRKCRETKQEEVPEPNNSLRAWQNQVTSQNCCPGEEGLEGLGEWFGILGIAPRAVAWPCPRPVLSVMMDTEHMELFKSLSIK